jgi:uncharacterized protein (DUF362 family)
VLPMKNNANKSGSELISVSKVYRDSDIAKIISENFSLWNDIKLDSNSRVLIKPNLCSIKSHETGTTTDPRIVEEIIRFLKNNFDVSDISIVESDGSQVLADLAFELLGYRRLAEKLDVKLVNLSKVSFSIKTFASNAFVKKIKVPQIFQDSTFFISVPKIKTHMDCYMTCALKNQYGCNPYWHKTIYHKRLDDAIVDFNTAFKPDMVVVDGIVAMDGRKGPTDGVPLRMNTLIIGRDSVAVDHFVSILMGIDPTKVQYIVEAERRDLGTTKYTIVGVNPDELKRKFNIKAPRWHNCYGILQNY